MNTDHQEHISTFQGGVVSDFNSRFVPDGVAVDAMNVLLSKSPDIGVVKTIRGNLQIPNSLLPSGTNITIGAIEDKQTETIVIFNYNSNSDHGIYRWDGSSFEEVIQSSELDFVSNRKVRGVVVDGRFLVWTDADYTDGVLSGNPPMLIDMDFTYPSSLTKEMITLIKPKPEQQPVAAFAYDENVSASKTLTSRPIQFRYRFVFWDESFSAWSAASNIPTPFGRIAFDATSITDGLITTSVDVQGVDTRYNKIVLELRDSFVNDTDWRTMIKSVQIAMRRSLSSPWQLADADVPIDDIDPSTRIHEFTSDRISGAIASDDVSTTEDQAIKNYDFVPRIVNEVYKLSSKEGDSVIALGGCLEQYDVEAVDFEVSLFQQSNSYDETPTVIPLPSQQTTEQRTLRHGGVYKTGIVFEDYYGRQSAVIPGDEISVPRERENGPNFYGLTFTINSGVPSWATRFRPVISADKIASDWFQDFVVVIKHYIVRNGEYVVVNPGTTPMSEISMIGIQVPDYTDTDIGISDGNYRAPRFDVKEGDRLQVVQWTSGSPDLTDEYPLSKWNFNIVKVFAGPPEPNPPSVGELLKGPMYMIDAKDVGPDANGDSPLHINEPTIIEVYRPRSTGEDLYYELPESYAASTGVYDVDKAGDAYQLFRGHAFRVEDGGDSITSFKRGILNNPNMTQEQISDGEVSFPEHGRITVEDQSYAEKLFRTQIRLSDFYQSQSLINGISSFRSTNYVRLNLDYGIIMRMMTVDQVMLAVCQYKSQPVYVQRDRLLSFRQDGLIGRSSDFLNVAQELSYDLGTHDPLSVVYDNGVVMGWDSFKGVVWRYTIGGGQSPVVDGNRDKFRIAGENYHNITTAIAGLDRFRSIYYLTIGVQHFIFQMMPPVEGGSYYIGELQFDGFRTPTSYSQVKNKLLSFYQGEMYDHYEGNYNEFYGANGSDPFIVFEVNPSPLSAKFFSRVRVIGEGDWFVPEMSVTPLVSGSQMTSSIPLSNMTEYEGQDHSDILRDESDPATEFSSIADPEERKVAARNRGRVLRGESLRIKLQLDGSNSYDASVAAVGSSWYPSESTR